MLSICVDDEELLLADLVRAVEVSKDIEKIEKFTRCSEALEWAKKHKVDIAFLDIEMRGCGGLELARQLREIHPEISIVFCTGYREYALEAFQIHSDGYLMKPITAEDVQKEIDTIKSRTGGKAQTKIKVQCFGNFDVFYDGKPLKFKRKRSKEVLAYLVDRKGSSVSAREICVALWEDDADEKNIAILYKLFSDLRYTLMNIGAEELLIKNNYQYAVNTKMLDCDYYDYLAGDPKAEKAFGGEYMTQYSWAEETAALLYYK